MFSGICEAKFSKIFRKLENLSWRGSQIAKSKRARAFGLSGECPYFGQCPSPIDKYRGFCRRRLTTRAQQLSRAVLQSYRIPIVELELDVLAMRFHRLGADAELLRNAIDAVTSANQSENMQLPVAERGRWQRTRRRPADQFLNGKQCDTRAHV